MKEKRQAERDLDACVSGDAVAFRAKFIRRDCPFGFE
jgi:hypothetical protein